MAKVRTNFHIALTKGKDNFDGRRIHSSPDLYKMHILFRHFFPVCGKYPISFHLLFFLSLSILFVSFTHPADGSTMDNQELLLSST